MPPGMPHVSRPKNTNRAARIAAAVAVAAGSAGLLAAAAPAVAQTSTPASLLHPGSSGPDVSHVQRALHVRTTGHFGSGTERAVLAYQRRDGLAVDGIVGPRTWDALFGTPPPSSDSSSSTTSAASVTSSSGSGGYSIPSGIVQCESGGDYSAVNPSSGAGGAYQILPSTWQAYGGQGLPQDAPKAEQDRIAGEIYAHQGASAWSC
jgi:peptidoglycan hydrolase-like protein with peptidoglycan-binding domain